MENEQQCVVDSSDIVELLSSLADCENKMVAVEDSRKRKAAPLNDEAVDNEQSVQVVDSSENVELLSFLANWESQMATVSDSVVSEPEEKKQRRSNDVDFTIDSPFLKMSEKIIRLHIAKKNMLNEIKETKKDISALKEQVSFLQDQIKETTTTKTKKYKKNSVMGQLEIIKEILTNMQK